METILSHFDADEYVSFLKEEAYEEAYEKVYEEAYEKIYEEAQIKTIQIIILNILEPLGIIPDHISDYINHETNVKTLHNLVNIAMQSSSVEEFWQHIV